MITANNTGVQIMDISGSEYSSLNPLQTRYESLRSEREALIEALQNQIQSEHSLKYDIQLLVEMLAAYYPEYVEIDDQLNITQKELEEKEELVENNSDYVNLVTKDIVAMKNSAKSMKPFHVNMNGHLIMPLMLGKADARVSIQSIGIIHKYPDNYHNDEFIYPIGFISKRKYIDPRNRSKKCHYNCEIVDGGLEGPIFQINVQGIITLENRSLSRLFQEVMRMISSSSSTEPVTASTSLEHHEFSSGEEFFGLGHPTIRRLIEASRVSLFNDSNYIIMYRNYPGHQSASSIGSLCAQIGFCH